MKYLSYFCFYFCFVALMGTNIAYGQKVETDDFLREVRILYTDSVVYAHLKDVTDKIKIDNTKLYYWYSKERIYSNRGGIYGKALHGTYQVIDKSGQLISEGLYKYGLKCEVWKKWSLNGELLYISNWRDGELHGKTINFDYNGNIESIKYYRNGKLHGKCVLQVNGERKERIFRNGIEVLKKQPIKKQKEKVVRKNELKVDNERKKKKEEDVKGVEEKKNKGIKKKQKDDKKKSKKTGIIDKESVEEKK